LRALIAEKDEEAARLSSMRENAERQTGGRFTSIRRLLLAIALLGISIGLLALPPVQLHLPDLVNELIDRESQEIPLTIWIAPLALGLLIKRRKVELGDKRGSSRGSQVAPLRR
jgi:hypothetical protein